MRRGHRHGRAQRRDVRDTRPGRFARPPATLVALAVLAVLACAATACSGDEGASSTTTEPPASSTTTALEPAPVPLGRAQAPVVIGHRGAAGHFPDNSIEGFEGAAGLGADWVELDVRLSSDRVPVLSHDPETAAGDVVADLSARELAAQGIVALDEALTVIEAEGLGVDVEIKGLPTEPGYDDGLAVADQTVDALTAAYLTVPFVVSSFNPAILDAVRDLTAGGVDTMRIFPAGGDATILAPEVAATGDEGVAVEHEGLTEADVAAYLDAGLVVWVWTLDDPEVAARLVDAGVEGIITDVPDVLSASFAEPSD